MLLLRHGAKSSSEGYSRTRLGYFTIKALLLYPPHALVMRLHGRDVSYVVIFIQETADLSGLREVTGLVGGIRHSW